MAVSGSEVEEAAAVSDSGVGDRQRLRPLGHEAVAASGAYVRLIDF